MRPESMLPTASWRQVDGTLCVIRLVLCAVIVALASPIRSSAYSTYSLAIVQSDGSVVGDAITDGTPPPGTNMNHTAYATATLTNPKGRKASNNGRGTNTYRAEVVLPFDPTDTGTFTEASVHSAYCPCMGWFIYNAGSSAQVSDAYPINFTQVNGYDAGGGVLHFDYTWSSSSGNLADIQYCSVDEIVTYPGTANPYYWPSPPWSNGTPNPTIQPNPPISGNVGAASDDHGTGSFLKPYKAAQFTAVQTYNYICGPTHGTLFGPLNIVRSVSSNGNGSFAYSITKSGKSASINPMP